MIIRYITKCDENVTHITQSHNIEKITENSEINNII